MIRFEEWLKNNKTCEWCINYDGTYCDTQGTAKASIDWCTSWKLKKVAMGQ